MSFAEFECGWQYGDRMTVLNVMGVTNAAIKRCCAQSKKKEIFKISWLEFAETFVQSKVDCFIPDYCNWNRGADFEFEESTTDTTVTMKATLRLYYYSEDGVIQRYYKDYYGESTRPVQTNLSNQDMKKEAKKNVLMTFFKDRFGITQFNDISIDELLLIGCK